jgi:hypothetical protein
MDFISNTFLKGDGIRESWVAIIASSDSQRSLDGPLGLRRSEISFENENDSLKGYSFAQESEASQVLN